MSFLTRNHRKAIVKLQLVDKDTHEVRELGFAAKLKGQGDQQLLVTSPTIFPEDIEEHVTDIVVDRFRSKSKNWKYKTKQKDQMEVKHVLPKQGCTVVMCKRGNKNEYLTMGVVDVLLKSRSHMSAYVFEEKQIIQLQFKNQPGRCEFTFITKKGSAKDFDLKRAKGAPIICEFVLPRAIKVVGVLAINSNGDLYPVLFTDNSLGKSF